MLVFQRAKSELIRLRMAEKQRHLILLEEAVGRMDEVVGLFVSRLSGFAAIFARGSFPQIFPAKTSSRPAQTNIISGALMSAG